MKVKDMDDYARVNSQFGFCVSKDYLGGDKLRVYLQHECMNAYGEEECIDITDGVKITGDETIAEARKIIKAFLKSNSITLKEVERSVYDEFECDEYNMTHKSTRKFINAVKKHCKVGNDFIACLSIYPLRCFAESLGY